MSILSYLNLSASQNKKSDPGIFDIFNPPTKRSKKMTEQQQLELAQTGAPPTEEKEYTSKFDKFTNYIDSKMFSKKSNDWTSFILESISYSILILIIGIIGGNLENISNLKDEKNKGNSYLLRNKFEGLFKHSLSANSQLKIDSSINPELFNNEKFKHFTVWCSLCDLSVQTKLLLQAWPLKIFDYANYVMCNISFTLFNDFLTKGKAFKAYFLPILLILIIYFQVPIIIGFIVALLGSAQHPNFPGYWFGGLAYLTFIKKILKNVFDYIVGDLACKRYEAMPDAIYILRPSRDKTSQAMGKLDDAGLLLDVSFDLVTEPIALTDNHRKNSVFSDLFLAGSEGMKGLDESGYKNMFRIGKDDNYIRKLAISRLIEIIEDTPCHMDAYDIRGKKIKIRNAKCIDLNINLSLFDFGGRRSARRDDNDINSFKELAINLFTHDSGIKEWLDWYDSYVVANPSEGAGGDLSMRGLGEALRATRRKEDKFKYFVNPICIADVEYLDATDYFRDLPIYTNDVKFWLWSKTSETDRKKMYEKLRREINDDPTGYFRSISFSSSDESRNPDRTDNEPTGRKKAKEIINIIEQHDIDWHNWQRDISKTDLTAALNKGVNEVSWKKYNDALNYENKKKEAKETRFKTMRLNSKRQQLISLIVIRSIALLFIIYKAFEMGSAKHMHVDPPARKSSQDGGRGAGSGNVKAAGKPATLAADRLRTGRGRVARAARAAGIVEENVPKYAGVEKEKDSMFRLLSRPNPREIETESGLDYFGGFGRLLPVELEEAMKSFLSRTGTFMDRGLTATTVPAALAYMVGYIFYICIIVIAMILKLLWKVFAKLFIELPSDAMKLLTPDQKNIFSNFMMYLIKLVPFIVVFNLVGIWFAPLYGLAACIAYAIFVQIKFVSFTLFGTKDSNFIKKHIKENRFGLTLLASIMIAISSAKNLRSQTAFGVSLSCAICMFILSCSV